MIKKNFYKIFNKVILLNGTLLFLIILSSGSLFAQDCRINEFCPSNSIQLADENGNFPDWIEIYNPGPEDINLSGYGLSDDKDSLLKWTFPNYLLGSNKYLVLFASGINSVYIPGFWNMLITEGDSWKYIVPESELPTNWTTASYNDSEWLTGPSGFGYGDGDDNTILNSPLVSVFLRKSFIIEDTSAIEDLVFSMDYDDGFVAYLNGTEIARENIGVFKIPPAFNATATDYTEPVMIFGGKPNNYELKTFLPLLKNGENILAIQVHNNSEGSSDLTAIPFLSFKSGSKIYEDPIPVLGLNSSSFHTNFKLNKSGDSLYLSYPNGSLKQSILFGSTQTDVSYGFPNESGDEIKAFTNPTPWLTNSTQAYNYRNSNEVIFSKESGFYSSLELILSSGSIDDKIYFTKDGSDPDETDILYSNPLRIMETSIIKARIINPGYLPGEIYFRSYGTGSLNGLPSVFISTDPKNLFDNETGIYVKGSFAEAGYPYFGANFWQDWEKPAGIEYFDQNGDPGFRINAGIKIFGGWSRGQDMKSFSVFARGEYGDKNIPYKLFDDKDIEKFEAFVLRNSGNEWFGGTNQSGVMFRDLLMARVAGLNNVDMQAGRPVSVYLNGQYWGIHNLREKVNENYISSNHSDIDPDRIHLLMSDKQIIQGDNSDYISVENFISANPLSNQNNYEYIDTKIDINNFINYTVAQIYYDNQDWPGNNIKFWKFDAEYSKWRWILYDTDFGLGMWDLNKVYNNTLTFATATNGPGWPNPPWSTFLLRNLLQNPTFKNEFINTMADRMNTVYKPDIFNEEVDQLKLLYKDEMVNHISRWGGNYSTWEYNIENIKSFINLRPDVMRGHIRAYFGISTNRTVNVSVSGCPEASINLNSLILNNFPWSGIYFNQIPVSVRAITPEGYRFVRWEGSINSTEQEITLDMKSSMSVTAIYEPYTEKEFEGVIINEIAYNNPNGSKDWVELYNNSSETKDISGWILKDSDPSHRFKIAPNTLLLPKDFLVIVEEQEAYYNSYNNITKVAGNANFAYKIAGECIRLYNAEMQGIDSVCYVTEYPWPVSPVTTGHPIALSNPNSDNNVGFNWNATPQLAGTPGKQNSSGVGVDPILVINNKDFSLYQNYPNPFDLETKIAFSLSEGDEISIEVYNLNGILISNINSNYYSAGYHEIIWNSGNLSSGIYILKVSDSNSIQQKRMFINK
ncbi:MAG: CotH kinase family protein [Bacteroidales bacterium]|nr:CotH kinase family protein [Bacteroidales bacterium]MCF8391010.1 CotH kinase family protein [Bacteroidales bacterium]